MKKICFLLLTSFCSHAYAQNGTVDALKTVITNSENVSEFAQKLNADNIAAQKAIDADKIAKDAEKEAADKALIAANKVVDEDTKAIRENAEKVITAARYPIIISDATQILTDVNQHLPSYSQIITDANQVIKDARQFISDAPQMELIKDALQLKADSYASNLTASSEDGKNIVLAVKNMTEVKYPMDPRKSENDIKDIEVILKYAGRASGTDSKNTRRLKKDARKVLERVYSSPRVPTLRFSMGVFGCISSTLNSSGYLQSTLQNKTYSWQQVPNNGNNAPNSSSYVLTESGYTSYPAGISALINQDVKICDKFGLALSTGFGLTLQGHIQLAYLLGGGIYIGSHQQFFITGGMVVMYANKLNNNLQAVADQHIMYTAPQNISYYKELKTGVYISISFTPFKK